MAASARLRFDLDLPDALSRLALPEGIVRRLQALLDKQDRGETLGEDERLEAEGLVNLADLLALLRLRATRTAVSPRRR